jgi:hypothetical protein
MTEQHSSSARALTETKLPRLQKLAWPIFLQRLGSKVSWSFKELMDEYKKERAK